MCLGIALSYDLVEDVRKEGKVECSDHGGNADVEEAMTLGLMLQQRGKTERRYEIYCDEHSWGEEMWRGAT